MFDMKDLSNIELTQLQKDVLVGSILGDGHLRRREPTHNTCLSIKRASLDLDYLTYEFEIFKNLCTDNGIKNKSFLDKRTNNTYYSSYFDTRNFYGFNEYHEKWYKNSIKVIPEDLELNHQIIAIWLADDGHFAYTNTAGTRLTMSIATNSFTKEECEFLCRLLNKLYNTDLIIQRSYCAGQPNKFQYIISGEDNQARSLLKQVDKYFELDRKSKLWRTSKYDLFGESNKATKSKDLTKQIKIIEYILNNKEFTIGKLSEDLDMYFTNPKNGYKDLDPTVLSKLSRYAKEKIVLFKRESTLKKAIIELIDPEKLSIELNYEKAKMNERLKCRE